MTAMIIMATWSGKAGLQDVKGDITAGSMAMLIALFPKRPMGHAEYQLNFLTLDVLAEL